MLNGMDGNIFNAFISISYFHTVSILFYQCKSSLDEMYSLRINLEFADFIIKLNFIERLMSYTN